MEFVDSLITALLQMLSPLGITEPVFQFMLIAAILGLSIYLTLYTGMFALANAGFMAIGAYVSVVMTQQLGVPLEWSLVAGALIAGLVAIPIGLPVLRLRDIYLAIATIGFSEVVRILLLNFDNMIAGVVGWLLQFEGSPIALWLLEQAELSDKLDIRVRETGTRITVELLEGARGITGIPKLTETWMLIFFIFLVCLFMMRLHRSRFGRSMAAIRQDERAAANMGINVVYVKNVVFVMSAMLAAVAGGFEGHLTRIIIPSAFGFDRNVDILAYAVLGGTQTFLGPLVGGLVLAALPEVLRFLREYRGLFNGLVLLGVIVYIPGGLVNIEAFKAIWNGLRNRRNVVSQPGEQT
jgi:branched-chain amino acid transport system permease protein